MNAFDSIQAMKDDVTERQTNTKYFEMKDDGGEMIERQLNYYRKPGCQN